MSRSFCSSKAASRPSVFRAVLRYGNLEDFIKLLHFRVRLLSSSSFPNLQMSKPRDQSPAHTPPDHGTTLAFARFSCHFRACARALLLLF